MVVLRGRFNEQPRARWVRPINLLQQYFFFRVDGVVNGVNICCFIFLLPSPHIPSPLSYAHHSLSFRIYRNLFFFHLLPPVPLIPCSFYLSLLFFDSHTFPVTVNSFSSLLSTTILSIYSTFLFPSSDHLIFSISTAHLSLLMISCALLR